MKYSLAIGIDLPKGYPAVFNGKIKSSIESAKNIGYKAVEIHLRDPQAIDMEELSDFCTASDIEVTALSTGLGYTMENLSLIDEDSSLRKLAVERLISHIKLAGRLHSSVIIGLMRGKIHDFSKYDGYLEYLVAGIRTLIEEAEKMNVILHLEAINRFQCNYLNSIEETLGFVHRIGSPRLKVHADTFHMNIEEPNPCFSLMQCGSDLGYVHYSDSNRRAPGSGHFDFIGVMRTLINLNYTGAIGLEYVPKEKAEDDALAVLNYLNASEKVVTNDVQWRG